MPLRSRGVAVRLGFTPRPNLSDGRTSLRREAYLCGGEPGSELLWAAWATPGLPFPIPVSYFKWLVFADSTWEWRSFDLANPRDHEAWAAADRKLTPILSATDPNLHVFRARGGKLIQYHGWNDQLITPEYSVDYYESVVGLKSAAGRSRAGALADAQQFYRLFMAPGMAHCGGGNGPNEFDMERALYPKVAAYRGEGDINDAASFACR